MKPLILLSFFITIFFNSKGQNIGGEIIFNKTPSPYTYDFTLAKYTSYPSANNLSLISINMGDGVFLQVNRTDSFLLSNNILYSRYICQYSYPLAFDDNFVISYEDSTNNTYGINFPNFFQYPFYLQSVLKINPFLGTNNSVYFADKPIMLGDINKSLKQNITAIDIDGDSLSFELIDLDGTDSNQYWIPSTMSLNPINGELSWNNPQQIGEYAFGVLVSEWRYGMTIGFVARRFQIKIDTLNSTNYFIIDNWNADSSGTYVYHITPNTNLQLNLCYSDSLADSLKLNAYSDVFLINNPAIFTDSISFYNIFGLFSWTPDTTDIRNNPYIVTFRGGSYLDSSLIEQDVTLMIYVENITSINEINYYEEINIFPNPLSNYTTLKLSKTLQNATLCIYDILGKEVKQMYNINGTEIIISSEEMKSGMYFFTLLDDKGFVGKGKMIVE